MSQLLSSREADKITELLRAVGGGEKTALDRLLPLVYLHLRRIARRQLARERRGHTFDSVALVSEAFLRLAQSDDVAWQNRAHFFGVAANVMRRILVDHARARKASKRGGGARPLQLVDTGADAGTAATVAASALAPTALGAGLAPAGDERLLEIDAALERLATIDREASRIVELRFFTGATEEEASQAMGISPATARRRWAFAKAWLKRELGEELAS